MPPYDSDSSDDGEDYTETNVLLGYASEEPTGDSVSHLGGQPTWLDGKTAPSGSLAKCKVCNGLLSLLLELNGELPEQFPGHERRLYVWACRRKTCRRKDGSVRGIRGVRITKGAGNKSAPRGTQPQAPPEENKPLPNIGGSLFGVKEDKQASAPANPFSNPFSTGSSGKGPANPFSSSSANPFSAPAIQVEPPTVPKEEQKEDESKQDLAETFASKVKLNTPPKPAPAPRPHEPWPAESSFPPVYPHYHLDAEYETLDAPSTPQIPSNVRLETEAEASSGGGKEDKEVFESSLDKTFQKFADRVGENPEQVLRYEFKGKPLLYSDADAVGKLLEAHSDHGSSKVTTVGSRSGSGMPRCQNCGADRVFEVQLTPHAITELEAQEMSIDGMEWGTIILGVCAKDCKPDDVAEGEVGYLEEWVGVQWEEDVSKR
ncbi:hypothetical protein M011DRAFT_435419 [Sporormia fimetaria CBS 119925]|uniref:Programmed cell death protein 2 C-terminal domain-containing protein n=1 Tax=Sporormia fimetaria CBS 119925 TaxID=1340428 RepID=A0A6A6VQI0_9PLEO|nr:hypothetical protein M011DRAFT_435419 [Sporormia fimetaria CBS 119925]